MNNIFFLSINDNFANQESHYFSTSQGRGNIYECIFRRIKGGLDFFIGSFHFKSDQMPGEILYVLVFLFISLKLCLCP